MPLTDLVQHLNHQHNSLPAGRFTARFRSSGDGQVFVHFANLALESVFLPIIATASHRIYGHAATLRVYGLTTGNPVSADAVFVLPTDDQEFVYVDRLVRTLHALSYLARPLRGTLLLKVNRRHVMSVPTDHGLAFEEILRSCGLTPQQITLELAALSACYAGHWRQERRRDPRVHRSGQQSCRRATLRGCRGQLPEPDSAEHRDRVV